MNKKLNSFILTIALAFLISCDDHNVSSATWKPDDGYIANESSAAKMVEIVWLNVYGAAIEVEKPFNSHLKNGNIWIVEGTLAENKSGGVAYIEIQRSDGKILKVTHGK